jgi:hypothetical protein
MFIKLSYINKEETLTVEHEQPGTTGWAESTVFLAYFHYAQKKKKEAYDIILLSVYVSQYGISAWQVFVSACNIHILNIEQ